MGSGVAVFTGSVLAEQLKFKLDKRCSNYQAEQLAIVKALEVIETHQVNHNEHRTAVITTDSKITLGLIRSAKNHNHLAEEIRKTAVTLNKKNREIEFKWVKVHAGIYGNEIVDRLAKEATQNYQVTYSRIPKSAIKKDNRKARIRKWQSQWEETTKGVITKDFFPRVVSRLAVNLNLNPKCNNNYDRPWKYSILLALIKNYKKYRVPMQTLQTNSRPSDIPVQKAKERKINSEEQCT